MGVSTISSHLACALLVSQLSQLYRSQCYCEQQNAKIWKKHFLLDFLWVSETSTSTTRTEGVALCILAAPIQIDAYLHLCLLK